MKTKDVVKLDIVELDESETYPEETILTEHGLYRYLHWHGEQHGKKNTSY